MTHLLSLLHAMFADGEGDRGAAAVELSLVGALFVVAVVAVATLFDGQVLKALE